MFPQARAELMSVLANAGKASGLVQEEADNAIRRLQRLAVRCCCSLQTHLATSTKTQTRMRLLQTHQPTNTNTPSCTHIGNYINTHPHHPTNCSTCCAPVSAGCHHTWRWPTCRMPSVSLMAACTCSRSQHVWHAQCATGLVVAA
jgi:hypothetical protein